MQRVVPTPNDSLIDICFSFRKTQGPLQHRVASFPTTTVLPCCLSPLPSLPR